MTAAQSHGALVSQQLSDGHDFDAWRDAARALLAAAVPPERVIWHIGDAGTADLFANSSPAPNSTPAAAKTIAVPRDFLALARSAILHCDPARHALLYRLLWRLQQQPGLLRNAADPDVRHLNRLRQQVARDIHKMRAFVRFRRVGGDTVVDDHAEPDETHYVAWFEPDHAILRINAAFFVNRFAQMRWSILTPQGSLHWDGTTLREGPPATADQAPDGDGAEELWLRYYASTFNPARLKIDAMVKEMPRRYWKNLPEAALIPALVAGAQQREAAMVAIGQSSFPTERPTTLDAVATGIAACRACAIGCNGTRAVAGEGPADAALAIIGEQPGDQEERLGRPFVGPAGQLLDQHLSATGIDRERAWVSNAVKHFKFSRSDKRRLHQSPTAGEIDHCRWWLESELALVKPRLILALGASAARGLLGRTVSVQRERGQWIALGPDRHLLVTVHPSYLLRLDGAARATQEQLFQEDLLKVAARWAALSEVAPSESRQP